MSKDLKYTCNYCGEEFDTDQERYDHLIRFNCRGRVKFNKDNPIELHTHSSHYKKQGIDTITRAKANMSLEGQRDVCMFMIDKYLWREKGQNLNDIKKIRDYLDWLEEVELELKDK